MMLHPFWRALLVVIVAIAVIVLVPGGGSDHGPAGASGDPTRRDAAARPGTAARGGCAHGVRRPDCDG
jgi:hypothetical protein